MASASITCVVPDGTATIDGTLIRHAYEARIEWPVGDGGEIDITVVGADGAAYDLASCTLTMVCRRHISDATPAFAYEATFSATPADGTATVDVLAADTAAMTAGAVYLFDVRLVDKDGVVMHIMPPSKWIPVATVARADEPPTES
jgi:hypothetical protein